MNQYTLKFNVGSDDIQLNVIADTLEDAEKYVVSVFNGDNISLVREKSLSKN